MTSYFLCLPSLIEFENVLALAATFAAIPFIGTYFAAIPGALELWLVHDEGIYAVLLILLHLLPTYVVDIAIYSEITGYVLVSFLF